MLRDAMLSVQRWPILRRTTPWGLDAVKCDVDAAAGCDAAESDVAAAVKHDAVGCNAGRAALRAFGAPVSMVPGARALSFMDVRRASFSSRGKGGGFVAKRMRNACEPLRF